MIHFILINPIFITLFSLILSYETKQYFNFFEAINLALRLLSIYFLYALSVWILSYSFSIDISPNLLWQSGIYSIWLYFCSYLIFIFIDESIITQKYQQVTSLQLSKIQNSTFWGIYLISATVGLTAIITRQYLEANPLYYSNYDNFSKLLKKIYLDILAIFVLPLLVIVLWYLFSFDYQKNIFLGRLCYEIKLKTTAKKIFERNSVLYPNIARNYYWLSKLQNLNKAETDIKLSLHYLQKASEIEPQNIYYKLVIMNILKIFEKNNEALEIASSVIQINPKEPLAWETLGDINTNLGNFEIAVNAYKKALECNPKNPIIQNNLAYLLLILEKDIGVALEMAKSSVNNYGSYVFNLDTLAWAYYKNGQIGEAYEIMQNITSNVEDLPTEIRFHDLAIKYKLKIVEDISKELSQILSSEEINKNILLKTDVENFIKAENLSLNGKNSKSMEINREEFIKNE